MTRLLITISLLIIGCLTQNTHACLWDRDTLAAEASGIPGVVDIIVGRFDRWPDEVYAVRLDRVTQELEADSSRLALYDDAGVACDRLGRYDEAIAWMARKRSALDAASGDRSEHEYRYLANLGTFHAHRWLAKGADRDDMADIETARDLIADAIELNPDAHFGREKYQLATIKWIIEAPSVPHDGRGGTLVEWSHDMMTLDPRPMQVYGIEGQIDPEAAIEGLTGLVVLGNAWESYDIFLAIAMACEYNGDASLARLASRRCAEILNRGGRSLQSASRFENGQTPKEQYIYLGARSDSADEISHFFHLARDAAEKRNQERNDYILAQIALGKHPDTHADFMDGFRDSPAPSPPNGLFGLDSIQQWIVGVVMFFFVLPMAIATALWFGIRFLIRRRRAARLAA